MGRYSRLLSITLNVATPSEGEPVRSQLWHRDPTDPKMCKVFIYLTDVGKDNGPFTYMKGSNRVGRFRNLHPQEPPMGFYPEKLEGGRARITECLGKAGTVIFCDTSGLHCGGYAQKGERLMFTAEFSSSSTPWPTLYTYSKDFNTKGLSRAGAYALGQNSNRFSTYLLNIFKKCWTGKKHYEQRKKGK